MENLIEEQLDMFIENGENLEIVERINTETNERDIAIRINNEEYSFTQFMRKIKVIFVERRESIAKTNKAFDALYKEIEKLKNKKGISIADLNQAMDLSNIK